jgi:hypothetical protein
MEKRIIKLTVMLTPSEKEALSTVAETNQQSISTVTRDLIHKGMEYNDWLVETMTEVLRKELHTLFEGTHHE